MTPAISSEAPPLQSRSLTYEVDDLVALSKLVPRGPVQTLRIVAGALVILLMFGTVGEAWALTGFIDWPALVGCLFVAVMVFVLTNRTVRAHFWLKLARRSPLHQGHSYAITPKGLRISSPKSVSEIQWTAFADVKRVGDRLFLFMSKRQAFIVPRRAFETKDEFEAFAAAARECWMVHLRL